MRLLEHLRASGSGNDRVVIRHGIARRHKHVLLAQTPSFTSLRSETIRRRVLIHLVLLSDRCLGRARGAADDAQPGREARPSRHECFHPCAATPCAIALATEQRVRSGAGRSRRLR